MASRVAVIGVNGAGKSTMIKLLIGELEANEEGTPNVQRYVASLAIGGSRRGHVSCK